MGRIRDIKNMWGVTGGENPQRADLWQLDMQDVVDGINDTPGLGTSILPSIPRYYTVSLDLPELKVRGEMVRRDSRPYTMPGHDEALDPVRIVFYIDDGFTGAASRPEDIPKSKIYSLLDTWRALVRAGRGALGSEQSITLNADYTIIFRFPITIYLLRGYDLQNSAGASQLALSQARDAMALFGPQFNATSSALGAASSSLGTLSAISGGLEIASAYRLENCWLSSFKIGQLSYEGSKSAVLDVVLHAENILQLTTA